jgi:hypothetical protein
MCTEFAWESGSTPKTNPNLRTRTECGFSEDGVNRMEGLGGTLSVSCGTALLPEETLSESITLNMSKIPDYFVMRAWYDNDFTNGPGKSGFASFKLK